MGHFRIVIAFFAGVATVITTVLVPIAYFGDKNERWAQRLAIVAFASAMILLIAVFYDV
jgi:hypothetical protein